MFLYDMAIIHLRQCILEYGNTTHPTHYWKLSTRFPIKKLHSIRNSARIKVNLLTMGHILGLARVIVKDDIVTGRKSSILGYISSGDKV